MCPVCLANVGFIAASATSATGLTALAVKKDFAEMARKSSTKQTRGEEDENRNNGTENSRNRSESFQSRIEGAMAGRTQGFIDARKRIDAVA
jgi:hypothetical protein